MFNQVYALILSALLPGFYQCSYSYCYTIKLIKQVLNT